MPKLYIIGGCNGAGKTTASFTILPEMLQCKEFVNADEIARGLSPFQPQKRVKAGGHDIPQEVIHRRFRRGLRNLFEIFIPVCHHYVIINNSENIPEIIGTMKNGTSVISQHDIWNKIQLQYHESK